MNGDYFYSAYDVRNALRHVESNKNNKLSSAMIEWYKESQNEEKLIIESLCANIINEFHIRKCLSFGPACALEILGIILLADLNTGLVSRGWWLEKMK